MKTKHYIFWICVALVAVVLGSCQDRLTTDPTAILSFSTDTLRFDTVFTEQGSATRMVRIYNRQKEAVEIESVRLKKGDGSFRINVDGESNTENLKNIVVRGGDSLFMFVKAVINPQDSMSPVLVEEEVVFEVNGNRQTLLLQAYGQDVIILRDSTITGKTVWGGDKPYLVFDTIIARGDVRIEEGTTFYMHDNATIFFLGGLQANGSKDRPIVFRGDRFDDILYNIPYDYASGKWGGLFLLCPNDLIITPTYKLNYMEVRSGMFGLFCQSDRAENRLPTVSITNCRLHNFSAYGLVLQNMNAEVVNTEISNCADYCVYLSGGKQTFVHNTIVNYFNNKKENVSIHSVGREDVPAVYISDLSKNQIRTEVVFKNNIVSGWRKQNIVLATALPDRYDGTFLCNFLRNDTLNTTLFPYNTYQQAEDTVFVRTYFSRDEHTYYDFRLDSVSPARDIADSVTAVQYPLDRNGNNRLQDGKPDAGCYEWLPTN